jgi:succinyl-CoA synthetase alpha subunit
MAAGILSHLAGVDDPAVLVLGITGKQGRGSSRLMSGFGTGILAGCTPGKGGQEVDGVPVYDSPAEALEKHPGINSSVLFVPSGAVLSAASELIESGVRFIVLTADGVPTHDAVRLRELANSRGSVLLGPNTVGMLDAGAGYLFGMIGGRASWARKNYSAGCVGVISRSGGLSQLLGAFHCRANLPGPVDDSGKLAPLWGEDPPGVSAVICVGGDPVPGTTMLAAARAFEKDSRTKVMAAYGETGTTQENDLAAAIASGEITKPVVMFLGGKFTKAGVAQSHAGAMIRSSAETWDAKRSLLDEAGVRVVERPDAVFSETARILRE